MTKCIVTKVLREPRINVFGDGFYITIQYKKDDKTLEKVLFFDYIEEAEMYKVGFKFEG